MAQKPLEFCLIFDLLGKYSAFDFSLLYDAENALKSSAANSVVYGIPKRNLEDKKSRIAITK